MEDQNKNGLVGLRNRGNTCYLNTAIQCLSNIPPLTEYFLMNNHLRDLNNRFAELNEKNANEIIVTNEYSKLIKAIWSSKWTPQGSSLEPKSLHEIIQRSDARFEGFEQHDAQEILSFILDHLHEGLKYDVNISYTGTIENNLDNMEVESIKSLQDDLKNKYSIIVDLFFGQYINKFSEQKENRFILDKYEMFNMLSVPIYGNTLYESFDKYFDIENLESKFMDEKMNIEVDAYKQIRLRKVPKYIIIVLKRYKNMNGHYFKIQNQIELPIHDLDLAKYSEGYDSCECKLRLISVGCHRGNISGGHYFAVCRHKNGNWYTYNDDHVSEFNIDMNQNMLFRDGYLFIYEKIE
jgi:ubiquitin C-terminal hydrolase